MCALRDGHVDVASPSCMALQGREHNMALILGLQPEPALSPAPICCAACMCEPTSSTRGSTSTSLPPICTVKHKQGAWLMCRLTCSSLPAHDRASSPRWVMPPMGETQASDSSTAGLSTLSSCRPPQLSYPHTVYLSPWPPSPGAAAGGQRSPHTPPHPTLSAHQP